MAVSALSRARVRSRLRPATISPIVLVLTLVAPVLDLLGAVQRGMALPNVEALAAGVATAALLVTWARYPRTSWLAAATLTALASVVVRWLGADLAPALSVLTLVALGIGGGFASASQDAEPELS